MDHSAQSRDFPSDVSKARCWLNCLSWWAKQMGETHDSFKVFFFFFFKRSSSPDFRGWYSLTAGFVVRQNMVSSPHFAELLASRTLLKGMFMARSGSGKKFQCLHTQVKAHIKNKNGSLMLRGCLVLICMSRQHDTGSFLIGSPQHWESSLCKSWALWTLLKCRVTSEGAGGTLYWPERLVRWARLP